VPGGLRCDISARCGPLLSNLARQLWHTNPSPVSVSIGAPPDGFVPVEVYAVLPNHRHPRWLVPLGPRPVTMAALRAGSPGKTLTYRLARRGVTVAAQAGYAGLGSRYFDRLVVSVDSQVPPREYSRWLVLARLGEELGSDRPLHASMHVRRVNPNAKPTLRLWDAAGSELGFAKVGWSPATRRLVDNEAAALESVHGRVEGLVVPELLAHGRWHDKEYLVTKPLPRGGRRLRLRLSSHVRVLKQLSLTGDVWRGPLGQGAYLIRRRELLAQIGRSEPEAAHVLGVWLDAMAESPVDLDFGRVHGDWTPWNLAQVGDRVAAWDWEHSHPHAPWGFDYLHWHFQQAIPTMPLPEAVRKTVRRAEALPRLGIPPPAGRLVVGLYLHDMFTRVAMLAVGGGGWNRRFYPQMLDVAAAWTAHTWGRAA
jgi:hypothetical protein